MNTYKNYEYEIKNERDGWYSCTITLDGKLMSKFESTSISDDHAKKEIDRIIHTQDVDFYILTNRDLYIRLAATYEKRCGYGSWQEHQARKFIVKNYNGDTEALTKKIFKTIVSRENSKLNNTIDHMTDMSMIEFRHLIEKLTEHKVCVNGGKSYLHIYNWFYKNGKKTNYRTDNYYISVGQNLERTEENAKMIAAKCLEFAKIENYGYKAEVPVEKF